MHIGFLKHGQGSTGRAVAYLLQEKDHKGQPRAEVRVLAGDPDLVVLAGDSIERKWRYSSAVIAWHPGDNPSESEMQAVLDDFIDMAGAELPDPLGGLTYVAVLHRDEDKPHIHVVIVREDATTGRAFNPAPPGHLKAFDAVRDLHNLTHGWASPADPGRVMRSAPDKGRRNRDDERSRIEADIEARARRGELPDRDALRAACEQHGEVTRMGKTYVSIKPAGSDRAMRFKTQVFAAESPNQAVSADESVPPKRGSAAEIEQAHAEFREQLRRRRSRSGRAEEADDDRRPDQSPGREDRRTGVSIADHVAASDRTHREFVAAAAEAAERGDRIRLGAPASGASEAAPPAPQPAAKRRGRPQPAQETRRRARAADAAGRGPGGRRRVVGRFADRIRGLIQRFRRPGAQPKPADSPDWLSKSGRGR